MKNIDTSKATANSLDDLAANPGGYTKLELSNRELSSQDWDRLPKLLITNNITSLSLTKIDLTHGDIAMSEIIKNNKTLTHLSFDNISLTNKETVNIFLPLQNNKTLTHFFINNTKLDSDESGKVLCNTLKHSETLTHISLDNTNLGSEGPRTICRILENNKGLKSFSINGTDLSKSGKDIGEALKTSKTLESLSLKNAQLGNEGSENIGAALTGNKTLAYLDLQGNEIVLTTQLALALMGNDTLTHLDLSKNKLNNDSTLNLTHGILKTKALTHLNLSDNEIGSFGGGSLCLFLNIFQPEKTELAIFKDGVTEFYQAISPSENKVLTYLNLNNNKIGTETIKLLNIYSNDYVKPLELHVANQTWNPADSREIDVEKTTKINIEKWEKLKAQADENASLETKVDTSANDDAASTDAHDDAALIGELNNGEGQ